MNLRRRLDSWIHSPRSEMAWTLADLGQTLGRWGHRLEPDAVAPLRRDTLFLHELIALAWANGETTEGMLTRVGRDRWEAAAIESPSLLESVAILFADPYWQRKQSGEETCDLAGYDR